MTPAEDYRRPQRPRENPATVMARNLAVFVADADQRAEQQQQNEQECG